MGRRSLFILSAAFCCILCAATNIAAIPAAQAFMSFPPHNNVHRAILEEGLKNYSLSKASIKIMAAGMDSQDNPMSANWSKSENHACDNKIKEAFAYIESQTQEAVALAKNAENDAAARKKCLYTLGLAMHTVQDFYSHANYVEWLTAEKKPLEPIDRRPDAAIPQAVRTCYYYYGGTLKQEPFLSHEENVRRLKKNNPSLTFRSEEEYAKRKEQNDLQSALDYALKPGQLLHMELNKDSATQLQGKVAEGKETLFSLAKALAVKDTERQWQYFEEQVKAKYGDHAAAILSAVKGQEKSAQNEP